MKKKGAQYIPADEVTNGDIKRMASCDGHSIWRITALVKDKSGRVIGFEKLNFTNANSKHMQIAFETVWT